MQRQEMPLQLTLMTKIKRTPQFRATLVELSLWLLSTSPDFTALSYQASSRTLRSSTSIIINFVLSHKNSFVTFCHTLFPKPKITHLRGFFILSRFVTFCHVLSHFFWAIKTTYFCGFWVLSHLSRSVTLFRKNKKWRISVVFFSFVTFVTFVTHF